MGERPGLCRGKGGFFMNGPRLTGSELADLLFRRDGGGVLLPLCREAEAEYVMERGDFLRFIPCDPETRARVCAQAEGWRLRTLWQESWDPAMGREDRSGSIEQAMEEPYHYLHALQADFDPGVLCYSREYRELQQETEELPWRVSFHGGLIGQGGRAGKAIPADTWFTWEGETWYVPALYRCPEGIVVDLLQRVDVETMWAYCGKWQLTPETDWDAMPEERRCQAQAEHPFCQDFRAMLAVNGRGLRQRHGCSSVWLPLWPDREDRDMQAALRHYGLDEGDCWQLYRLSFEWTGEKPRKCKDFALILSGEETDVPGPTFQVEQAGETVTFRHPVTGAEHTLTVRSVEPQDYDRPEDPGWDYPRYFTALGYTVTPDIPQEAFSVRDCAPADPARRKPAAPKDQLGGGTAVLFIGRDEEGRRWAASSMHFTPPERVTWRIHFHIVSRGRVTVELPGEK